MKIKSLFAASAVALALSAPAQANIGDVYTSAPFQGLTFTFTQTDADSLTFRIQGTAGGDWSTANFLAAFDLRDLGIDFGGNTPPGATANGPGANNLAGVPANQVNGNQAVCDANGNPQGSICFNVNPDQSIRPGPINFLYTIDFTTLLNIGSTGPHLRIAFTETAGGTPVGSLYSLNIAKTDTTDQTDRTDRTDTTVPEPATVALFALGLLALGIARRRQSN